MNDATQIEAIRDFFLNGEIMERFVNAYQTGARPWGSVLDHRGHLVVADADRSAFYAIQPHGGGYYKLVEYADPFAALDPDIVPGEDDDRARALAIHDTPEMAFRDLSERLELDLDVTPRP